MLIIFGHFFVPFLLVEAGREDETEVMITVAVLAWFLHFRNELQHHAVNS